MSKSRTDVEALRRRAEEYLKKASCGTLISGPSKQDAMTLVHELQLYQTELEMQCNEMQRTQAELEESRNKYVELYESIPIGYFTLDRYGTIHEVNPAGAAMLKPLGSPLRGRRFQLVLPVGDRIRFTDFCKAAAETGGQATCEVRLSRTPFARDAQPVEDEPDDDDHWVLIQGTAVRTTDPSQGLLRAAVMDITERKRAQRRIDSQDRELRASRQALQEVNSRLLNTQDEDRRVIARELHDDCCQQLALLIITANALEGLMQQPVKQKMGTMLKQLKSLLESIRHIAYGLHPAMWESTGIEEAARRYVEDFTAVTEVPVTFDARHVPRFLPRMVTTCLIRTLQEALHNVVKYADASAVEVQIVSTGSAIELLVRDNGKGFDPENQGTQRGLGFTSMRERVRLASGDIHVSSGRGQGTSVRIVLPTNGV